MTVTVSVVDYGAGNLRSVLNAVRAVGGEGEIVRDVAGVESATRLIIPGVGSFRAAMQTLNARGLAEALRRRARGDRVPILGICLGMQLLAERSEEDGGADGLGLVPGRLVRFAGGERDGQRVRVPHVGFNTIEIAPRSRLLAGLGARTDVYFTHSYRLPWTEKFGAARCAHGEDFAAAIEDGVVAGTQFHPEKSQANGLKILENFLSEF